MTRLSPNLNPEQEQFLHQFTPQTWTWKGYPICYVAAGDSGPAVILIHGFGASWGHWRKNIPALSQQCRVFAIDLLGFGGSAKPLPSADISYTFETWADQIADFCREVVGTSAYLVGNSIGCIVAMQTAVSHPDIVIEVALLNCSLRLLHERKRPWYRGIGVSGVQRLLGVKWFSQLMFNQIAKPKALRNILSQAYKRPETISDELIDMLLKPARDPGAVDVFVAFTQYSQGPLPEDLLPILPCPAIMLWGTADPWEPIKLGQAYGEYPAVKEFIPLEGVGHCPQDEAPELVNPILLKWILSGKKESVVSSQETGG
ncbi:MAG: alpha/beta fold hydrolase [Microcoleaceae cyanobacterium]